MKTSLQNERGAVTLIFAVIMSLVVFSLVSIMQIRLGSSRPISDMDVFSVQHQNAMRSLKDRALYYYKTQPNPLLAEPQTIGNMHIFRAVIDGKEVTTTVTKG